MSALGEDRDEGYEGFDALKINTACFGSLPDWFRKAGHERRPACFSAGA